MKQILNYIITDTIEEGTYGKVYKALNLLTNEDCAVKVFFDKGNIIDLRKEYDILSSLDHDNIIKCKCYFEQIDTSNKKQGYLVMEKGDIDMFEYLNKNLDLVEYINYIYDIIKGLEYMHSKKIVHGDIKLENIVLLDNKAKIIDFGFSQQLLGSIKHIDFIGTKKLIAPEIIIYKFCCCKSDIWSLGKLMQNIEIEFLKEGYQNYPRLSFIFMKCLEADYRLRPDATMIRCLFEQRYKDIIQLD